MKFFKFCTGVLLNSLYMYRNKDLSIKSNSEGYNFVRASELWIYTYTCIRVLSGYIGFVCIGVIIVDVGGAGRGRQQVWHDGPDSGVPRVILALQVQGNPPPHRQIREAKGWCCIGLMNSIDLYRNVKCKTFSISEVFHLLEWEVSVFG